MTRPVRAATEVLDAERRACGEAGDGVVREWSADRSECRIVFAEIPDAAAAVVGAEQQRARRGGYELEWKVYEHDPSATELASALVAANFQADDPETVLVLDLEKVGANRGAPTPEGVEVRTVRGEAGLRDVAHISGLLGRNDVAAETRRLAGLLVAGTVSVQVVYLAGEPVSCGRLHYGATPAVAELAGGRTVPAHRNQGLFTAVVRYRLDEASAAGRRWVFVDALPTSEPILAKRGFTAVTTTRPYRWSP